MIGKNSLRTWLTDGDRGVSEVIGSILVFGLVVMLMAIIQVQAVPNSNAGVEFEHSDEVRSDFSNLEVAIDDTIATDSTKSAKIKLGVDYPTQMWFYNPPPVNGRLSTADSPNIQIEHIESESSPGIYLENKPNPNRVELSTKSLDYTIKYNEQPAFSIRYEPAASYDQQEDGSVVRRTVHVDGQTISMVAIGGEFNEDGISAESIRTKPLSTPNESYTFTGTPTDPLTVRFPTRLDLSVSEWEDHFSEELVTNGGSIQSISTSGAPGDYEYVVLEFQAGKKYDLQMAKVGFGTGGETEAEYMVPVESGNGKAVVEVRDKYNNPVSGVDIDYDVNGASRSGTRTTGPNGRIEIERTSGGTSVEFKKDFDGTGFDPYDSATSYFTDNIVLIDAIGKNSGDEFDIAVRNPGSPRQIESVQVHHLTAYDGVIAAAAGTSNLQATRVEDGPDQIDEVSVGGTSRSFSGNPEENGIPQPVNSPVTLPSGTSTLTFSLPSGSSYPYSSGGAIANDAFGARVTLFFDDGSTKTFDVMLHPNDDS
jgi:hypothetical protein